MGFRGKVCTQCQARIAYGLQAKGEGKRQVRFEEEFGECDGRRSPDQDGRRVFYRDSGVSLYGTTDSSDRRWPR